MVGWCCRLNGHEFEQTLGDSKGQGSLRAAVHGVTKSRTPLSNSTATTIKMSSWREWMIYLWQARDCFKKGINHRLVNSTGSLRKVT